jgi:uncharacterized protein YjbJ (UPF0337 family)
MTERIEQAAMKDGLTNLEAIDWDFARRAAVEGRAASRMFPGTNWRPADFPVPPQRSKTMGSTSDKIKGTANEVAGKVRQAAGKAVDNHEEQAKGIVQEAKGKAQVAKGDAKDAVKNIVDKA